MTTAVRCTTGRGTDGFVPSVNKNRPVARDTPATWIVRKQVELVPSWQSIYQTTLMWEEIVRQIIWY